MDSINSYRPLEMAKIEAQLNSREVAKGVSEKDSAKLNKAAGEFEALFINHMLKTMRESSAKDDLFGGGKGEEVYTSMLDTELSNIMSQGEGIGLKKSLMSQLMSQMSIGEATNEIKNGKLESIKPVLNTNAALREFQSHVQKDEFRSPVAGVITSGYGLRKDPVSLTHLFHSGVDIKSPEGTPVYPASAGEVIFSGSKDNFANLVEIKHDNGYITRYGNNNELRVKKGDRVNPDDIIALVGSAEDSIGAHLHFETVVEGYAVNPVDLVNFN